MKKIFKMFVLLLLFNITKVEAITFTSSYIGNYDIYFNIPHFGNKVQGRHSSDPKV